MIPSASGCVYTDDFKVVVTCVNDFIPADGYVEIFEGVTKIEKEAFRGCKSLTSVTIPEGVTGIGDKTFYNCERLTSVTIPEGVTSIGMEAFMWCIRLTSVTIPEGVTSIGMEAFLGCMSLTSVVIPEGVTSIGAETFKYCHRLTSVTIPEGVTSIGEQAFYNCESLTSVVIPEGVTSIGKKAFRGCKSLTSVTIPESVRSIGKGAFKGCPLEEVHYGGGKDGWNAIAGDRPTDKGITVHLHSKIQPGNAADRQAAQPGTAKPTIRSKNMGTTSNYLDDWGCLEIKGTTVTKCRNEDIPAGGHVKIPEGVTSIGEQAFRFCHRLTSVVIPEGVTSIWESAFQYCKSLTSVVIPEGVTSIWDEAFDGCESLTSVTIPEGVTSIGENAFNDCKSLTSVVIPEGVTSIGDGAFDGCSSLTSVVIPEGVTSIGDRAFRFCSSLTSVVIPEGVTSIGELAFCGCKSLTSVTIPEGVTSIGESAFYKCKSLTSVTIPESVRSIGDEAFKGCPLEKVHYGGGKDGWNAIVGDRPMDKGITVHVHLHSKIQPGNAADRQAAQPGTAKLTMKCPSCEAEWQPGKSAGSMAACPFCGASLADKDEQPDTSAIQGVVRALILERGAELYKKESARQLKALLGDLAASFPRELKVLTIVVQEGVQERLLKADDDTDEEKREAAVWCKKYLTEYIGMADERAAEAVNILAAGLGWKPPL